MMKKFTVGEKTSILYAIFMFGVLIWAVVTSALTPFKTAVVLLSIPCALAPFVVQKMWKQKFGNGLIIWYIVFLFGSQFLGTVMKVYKWMYWDMIMHALAGVLLGFAGIELLKRVTKEEMLRQLSSQHVFWFIKGFGVFGGAMWEVYEFTMDEVIHTTMQGRGNRDTMTDLVFDLLGSYLVARWYAKKHREKYEQPQLQEMKKAKTA